MIGRAGIITFGQLMPHDDGGGGCKRKRVRAGGQEGRASGNRGVEEHPTVTD